MLTVRLRHAAAALAALVMFLATATPARAAFHLMQIEQMIGGVNGDTNAQAIQLRMRAGGQNQVQNSRIKSYDAAGANPIVLIAFPAVVPGSASGSRVLVVSAGFGTYSTPAMVPDFVMTNSIPAARMAAGRITFEDNFGTIYWSFSYGGAGYTGANTGSVTNDANGNFGPPFAGPLPTGSLQAVRFTGAATALSTTNAADYALTPAAAVFNNNAGTAFTITAPPAHCPADWDNNNQLTPADIAAFVSDWFASITNGTLVGDFDGNNSVNPADVAAIVNQWFNALSGAPCP